jgi:hypothetical protein
MNDKAHSPGSPQDRAPNRTSDLLTRCGFTHAFFTRRGGVSPPPWESLNFAVSTGDSPGNVDENLARAASVLGVEPARVYFLSQVHGTAAVVLQGHESRGDVVRVEGDITISRAPTVACGVRSADCGTVLLGDRRSGAVCAIHAGWRGTVRGVIGAGVGMLAEHAGGQLDLVAAVGPHIEACCFEVDDDVAAELAACSSLGGDAVLRQAAARPHVDLRRIMEAQLVASGVARERIDHVRACTVCESDDFFSFRREGAVSGRLLSAIVPRAVG